MNSDLIEKLNAISKKIETVIENGKIAEKSIYQFINDYEIRNDKGLENARLEVSEVEDNNVEDTEVEDIQQEDTDDKDTYLEHTQEEDTDDEDIQEEDTDIEECQKESCDVKDFEDIHCWNIFCRRRY